MTNAPSGPSTGAGPYQTAHFIIVDNKFLMLRALLLFAVLGICPTAEAAQKLAAKAESGELELADGTQARASIAVTNQLPVGAVSAWSRFADDVGGDWSGIWDSDTGVPHRLLGPSLSAPGTIKSADTARQHATRFLQRHVQLLAPGASPSDFRLISNVNHHGVRTVGFNQSHEGVPVIGGQVSFRYKNDRLVMVASEAFPNVTVAPIGPAVARQFSRSKATGWQGKSMKVRSMGAATGPFILPVIRPNKNIEYRQVHTARVAATEGVGTWDVYVDIHSGEPIARKQMLIFETGTVSYRVSVRRPGAAKTNILARNTDVFVNGVKTTTDENGVVTFDGDSATVETSTTGTLQRVSNQAGSEETGTFTLNDGGEIVWDLSPDELLDAQTNTYIHAAIAKEYARELAPDLAWLDERLPINVNINDSCNAFSDGNSINFFRSGDGCANTGQLADVVYHEFGHSLHTNSIIEGVGRFDGAHSEGLSDFLAASITGDPAMGRGFFQSAGPLRHIDLPDRENSWPEDVAGIHFTGLIFAGAMWDLRKLLITRLGPTEGAALSSRLFYATLQRATDIPSTYFEVLVEDDDNGDLSDGTPNICDINTAFGIHGLRNFAIDIPPLAGEELDPAGQEVIVGVSGLFPECPGDAIDKVVLQWKRGETDETTDIEMTATGNVGEFSTIVPPGDDGSVTEYKVRVEFADTSKRTFPDNLADSFYQYFTGETVVLYCNSFDENPFENGWNHQLSRGTPTSGADDWQWGVPQSPLAAGDPGSAFTGDNVIGNDLGGGEFDGQYQANQTNFAETPEIDLGNFSDVHLQYFRWLNVEDGFFDQATIYANNDVLWQNFDSDNGASSQTHHVDKEWRFHDVPISRHTTDEKIKIRFELASDQGLEFGGWTIDDVCVVAVASSVCGDGRISGAETCDDADDNENVADACRTNCRAPTCGDTILDTGEECDDGNTLSGDGCSDTCEKQGGGCQSGSLSEPLSASVLLLFGLLARARRRKDFVKTEC